MLENTGIIKEIDNLGRIQIPKEIRNNFNIKEKDSMKVFIKDNLIFIEKSNYIEGITRRVDEFGMIVIPIEIRSKLNILENNKFNIYLEGTKIILKKVET